MGKKMFIYERKAKRYDKYRIADGDMSLLNKYIV